MGRNNRYGPQNNTLINKKVVTNWNERSNPLYQINQRKKNADIVATSSKEEGANVASPSASGREEKPLPSTVPPQEQAVFPSSKSMIPSEAIKEVLNPSFETVKSFLKEQQARLNKKTIWNCWQLFFLNKQTEHKSHMITSILKNIDKKSYEGLSRDFSEVISMSRSIFSVFSCCKSRKTKMEKSAEKNHIAKAFHEI
ncbi:MAG: hypothetical protein A3F17_05120 [Gammaproteobacteria bacterium RIFCSPHIGHO2_12_FULL_41_15]|nr:MAG: hypothetical protein A3F17_05120 [Gammaproteobacteria bacterium RIFCSPHIGHO2_12_FULL_41_15]